MDPTHAPDEPVALIDLDGTLADYDGAMTAALLKLQSPEDEPLDMTEMRSGSPWILERQQLIKQVPGFWRGLPKIPLGFEVLDMIRSRGFRLMVLTNAVNLLRAR